MRKIFALLFSILILTASVTVYGSAPDTRATSVILATMDGQQIVHSKNPDEQLPPAEFTKLMCAYTAYKIYGNDTIITVPDNLGEYVNYMENRMNLKAGEELPVSSLIKGLIMAQANDAAMTIALYYGGVDEYVSRMNEYAKELGMANSKFTNPTGNSDSSQYSTAEDLLKLYRAFYADGKLYPYLSSKNVTIPATNLSAERTYWTKNHLMSRFIYLDYIYEYANAGLSSSSSSGGYSVISTASKGTKNLVCIVLDSDYENGVNYAMIDAQELFDYGFDKYSTVTVTKQGDLLYEANLKNQRGKGTLLLKADTTLKGIILDTDMEEHSDNLGEVIKKEVVIDEYIKAPVKKDQPVGKIIYTYRGNLLGEVNLVAERDVSRSILRTISSGISWFFNLPAIKVIILTIVAIIVIFFILVINSGKKNRRGRRRNRRPVRRIR